jgi:hypothetical protein
MAPNGITDIPMRTRARTGLTFQSLNLRHTQLHGQFGFVQSFPLNANHAKAQEWRSKIGRRNQGLHPNTADSRIEG